MNVGTQIKLSVVDQASSGFKKIAMALQPLKIGIEDAKARFDQLQKKTEKVRKSFQKVGEGLTNIGKNLAVGVTAPVVAGAAISVNAFGDFQKSMAQVKSNLDETSFGTTLLSDGFKKMNDDILNLAKNSPLALNDLSTALFDSVSAGIDASKAVGFVGTSARLAVAGLTNATVSTDALTSAIHAYGYSAEDAELLAAKFFHAQKRGKTTVEQLATDFGKVAAMAKTTGVTFDEVLASVSAATLGAIKTNEAYTSLKAILSNVQKPTKDAAEVMGELEINFSSAALRSKGLLKFLKEIMDAAKSKKKNLSEVFERAFGSVEALNLASAITGQQFEAFSSITKELGDEQNVLNGFSKAYNDIAETQNNKIDVMKNKFRVLAIQIGEKLAPTVSKVIDKFSQLFSWIDKNPKIVETAMVFAGLAAMIAPIIIPLGLMVSMFASLITAVNGLLALKTAWTAWLLASKIGIGGVAASFSLIAIQIAGVIAIIGTFGYVIYTLLTRFEDVKFGWLTMWNNITDTLEDSINNIKAMLNGFIDLLPDFAKKELGLSTIFKVRSEDDIKRERGARDLKLRNELLGNGIKPVNKIDSLMNQAQSIVSGVTNTNVTESKVVVDFKNMPQGVKVDTKKVADKNIGVNYGFQGATK